MKWTTEEENFVLKYLDKYKLPSELPAVAMAQALNGRSPTSIIRKARRLIAEPRVQELEWGADAVRKLSRLYLDGLSTLDIQKNLPIEATIEQIEAKIKKIKEGWTEFIIDYAEARGLPYAKSFKLDTFAFFIKNHNTTSDFTRKMLHGKIKNG